MLRNRDVSGDGKPAPPPDRRDAAIPRVGAIRADARPGRARRSRPAAATPGRRSRRCWWRLISWKPRSTSYGRRFQRARFAALPAHTELKRVKANPRLTVELDRLRARTPRHSGLRPPPQDSSGCRADFCSAVDLRLCRRPYYFVGGLNGRSVHLRTAGSCSGSSSQSVHT
jgi:hypothetical protein